VLRVQGDPTSWGLSELDIAEPAWLTAGDPVALAVVTPLAGTLLLAPGRAGSLALSPVPPGGGWVPCVKLPSPYLYLPSPAGVLAHAPGYVLAGPDTDLASLQQAILAAMHDSTLLTVTVNDNGNQGVVLLNGAQLAFAVLAQAEET